MSPSSIAHSFWTALLWAWNHAAQIGASGALFSSAYYVVTRSWRAHASPAKPTWRVFVEVVLELLPNIPGAINKILLAFGKPGILPTAQAARTTPPSDGQSGCAAAEGLALALAAVCLLAGLALSGCPASYSLPSPSGCTPHAYRCSPEGWPQVCSATQRWTPIGDSACRDVHAVCCSVESYGAIVSACVPESRCLPEPAAATADGGVQ